VLKGKQKNHLQQQLENAYLNGEKTQTDYSYYPDRWVEPYKGRRKACGLQLYDSLNITVKDKDKRQQQWVANYHSFHAPVLMLFFMDKIMQAGSYMDYGMFLQSLMLAATEQGLASCAQAALCDYSPLIREFLGYDSDKTLVCGMALGYEDTAAKINNYRTPREPITSFTEFFGQE
jgi:nitroreductase